MDSIDKFLKLYSYKFDKGYPDINNEQDILLLESILKEDFSIVLNEISKLSYANILERTPRLPLLKKKFQNKSPFTNTKTGEDLIITKITIGDEEFTPDSDLSSFEEKFKNNQNVTITHSGGVSKLSILAKTKEFGGGSGSGGGTANTKTQESSQALVNSLRQNEGTLSLNNLSNTENLKKAYNNVDVDESLEKMINFIQNSDWKESLVGTANILANKFGTDYTQHRGSSFVNNLYDQYNKLRKEDERIGKGRIGSDKWNPADIWMVKEGLESTLNNLITSTTDLDELNVLLLQQYLDKNLIGVSLKKTDLSPKTSEYNTTGLTQNIDYVYGGYKPLNFSTKSTFIFYDKNDNEIEFRSFPAFAGQIKGSKAAGGKIGETALNVVFSNLNLPQLENPKSVTNENFIELWNKFSDQSLNEKTLNQNLQDISNSKTRGQDYTKGEAGAKDWLQSRYFGLQVLDRIDKAGSQEAKNQVMVDMLKYAASNSNWSSAFIKIS